MEHGFYNPTIGYWQTISTPTQEILDSYPEGTIEVPLKPSKFHKFVNGDWILDQEGEDNILKEWREGANTSREAFCMACFKAGILSSDEAVIAAQGVWPASFDNSLVDFTDSQIVEAKIQWACTNTVQRNSVLLEKLRTANGLTHDAIDALFY